MEHGQFIEAVAERVGGRLVAEAAVQGFVESIVAEVASGGRVALAGFGVFDAPTPAGGVRAARPRFRPASAFRDRVAAAEAPQRHPVGPVQHSPRGPVESQKRSGDQPAVGPRRQCRDLDKGEFGTVRFQHFVVPAGFSLSAVLPAQSSRCGIYVLHFDDGYHYVGQAIDVLTRFAAHRRRWGDRIVGLDFAPTSSRELDDLERRTIQWYEAQERPLYNSALVGLPMGKSPLDLVVDRVDQEQWLDDQSAGNYDLTDRIGLAERRPRGGESFRRLSAHGAYPGLRIALLMYLMYVVPWPHETERRFWSMTSMPSTKRARDHRRLVAVSVNNVETLVLAELHDEDGWFVGGFVNVAPGIVTPRRDVAIERARYRTIGEVDRIVFEGWEGLVELLQHGDVVDAARRTALGLMRKGRGMMARFHDESLADDVFSVLDALGDE